MPIATWLPNLLTKLKLKKELTEKGYSEQEVNSFVEEQEKVVDESYKAVTQGTVAGAYLNQPTITETIEDIKEGAKGLVRKLIWITVIVLSLGLSIYVMVNKYRK